MAEAYDDSKTLEQMEREALAAAIRSQGSIAGAARRLGIGRATAFRKVKKYGLRFEDLAYVPAAEPDPPAPPVAPDPPKTVKPVVDPLFANWKP